MSACAAAGTSAAGQEVGQLAHKMAGMGGSLGFQTLSVCAKAVDTLAAAAEPENVFRSKGFSDLISEIDRIIEAN